MKKQFNRFLRWILFLWVKVEVFPADNPASIIDSERPTLYVLADRGVSDLLVLTQITHRYGLPEPIARIPIDALRHYHSVYSIASRNPLIDWIKRRRKHSAMLSDLMRAFAEDENWQGISSKQDFLNQQADEPFLLSMGIDSQRDKAT